MSITRTTTVLAAGLTVVMAAPTAAAPIVSPVKLAEVAGLTVRPADVRPVLGVTGAHTVEARDHAKSNPYLCYTDRLYQGRKTDSAYTSAVALAGTDNPLRISQRVFVYHRQRFAARSFASVARKARQCYGVWKSGNWLDPGDPLYRQRLFTGRTEVRSYGKRGVWIAGNFEIASAISQWAADTYTVYFRVGHTVQAFTYEISPEHASGVSMTQRRAVDRLAWRMALRWQNKLGPRWH